MNLNDSKSFKINKIAAYILVVLLVAATCGLAAISGSHSFTNTYDIGKTCDVRYGSISNLTLSSADGGNDYFWAATYEEAFNWNYLYIDIYDADFEEAFFEIQGYNGSEPEGESIVFEMVPGYNIIELNGEKCDSVMLKIIGEDEVSFSTRFMEFRENKAFFSVGEYLYYVTVFLCAIVLISMAVLWIFRRKGWKIDWYAPIDFLQDIYISFGNRFVALSLKVPYRLKKILRIAALVCWMFWIMLIYNTGKYMLTAYFKYNVVLFCITMLLVAVSMLKKPLKKQDWNRPLVHAWLWLSICMCVSEFFISKRFCMIGYVNLTVFGFYYFVWNNLDDKNKIIYEIIIAFKTAFFISFCFTLLCRPRSELAGLIGHTWNTNIYGIFCAIVLMGFLASIRRNIFSGGIRIYKILNILGAMVSLSFVLLAGSRAGILLAVPGLIFFMAEYVSIIRKKIMGVARGVILALCAVIVFYGIHVFLSWATVNLPVTAIVFSWDSVVPNEITQSMISIGMETPSAYKVIFNADLTNFLSARNLYWLEYLRDINFFGHEYYPEMWGGARYPHNGILGIVYRYGIIAAVPYILMFANAISIAFKKYVQERKNKDSISFYIWICVIGISLCMFIENFERPFLATEWLWWYWCLGILFFKKDAKPDRL